jgi:transcriptional regulator with XRE-family HTH domain
VTRTKQSDPRIAFGKAVRALRTERGLSQEKLAELSEIHRTYIGDVERGTRNIALVNMLKIATALDITLTELIQNMEKAL